MDRPTIRNKEIPKQKSRCRICHRTTQTGLGFGKWGVTSPRESGVHNPQTPPKNVKNVKIPRVLPK
jgi:hypothetical protein